MLLFINAFAKSIAEFFNLTSPLEWAGVISGLACVWLAAKNNTWNWPIACISVLIYVFIFANGKLYADAALQVYFLATNIYGWYYWSKNKGQHRERKVGTIKKTELFWSMAAIACFTVVFGFTLHHKTDASFPFLDSFCTACSVVAQIFLARKVLENWLIWIFVDVIYVAIYFSKDLFATGLMYAIYVIIAVIGFLDWRKIYLEQAN